MWNLEKEKFDLVIDINAICIKQSLLTSASSSNLNRFLESDLHKQWTQITMTWTNSSDCWIQINSWQGPMMQKTMIVSIVTLGDLQVVAKLVGKVHATWNWSADTNTNTK